MIELIDILTRVVMTSGIVFCAYQIYKHVVSEVWK